MNIIININSCCRSVGEKFDMSKSSLNDSVRRVVQSLNSIANEVITWPIGEQLAASKEKFNHLGDTPMPGVIGAIDGSYIFIKQPNIQEVALHYKCRKMQYAIVLQAICDADLRLIDYFTGYPGSVGDYRIFRNSDICKRINRNPPAFFPNGEYIIGDKAYSNVVYSSFQR
ncbi:protein ALP1-like [Solenopsis invicta]|uniref:protein ALP1-like n=1 Tax=Solenopsis invicta TaxID=13686 RepID=UPI00193EC0D1|nr:protein ALP1-like [Solenopsis invicta]